MLQIHPPAADKGPTVCVQPHYSTTYSPMCERPMGNLNGRKLPVITLTTDPSTLLANNNDDLQSADNVVVLYMVFCIIILYMPIICM